KIISRVYCRSLIPSGGKEEDDGEARCTELRPHSTSRSEALRLRSLPHKHVRARATERSLSSSLTEEAQGPRRTKGDIRSAMLNPNVDRIESEMGAASPLSACEKRLSRPVLL